MRHHWMIVFLALVGGARAQDLSYPCAAGPIVVEDWDIRRVDSDFRQVWATIRSTSPKGIAKATISVEFFAQGDLGIGSLLFLNAQLPAGGSVTKTENAFRSFGGLLDIPRKDVRIRVCTDTAILDDGTKEVYQDSSAASPLSEKK